MSHLTRILVRSGHSPKRLARDFRAICQTLDEPTRPWDSTRLHLPVDLGQVISVWYSDPAYTDGSGAPRGMALSGNGISVESVIERCLPDHEPDVVIQALLRIKAIRRRNGLYFPSGRYVALREDTARIRSLSVLMGILRTVERNVTGKHSAALLERNASHPNFPVAALPGFHGRLKLRAGDFLADTDTDMLRREKRHPGGRRTRLGVEIFAFEEPLQGRSKKRRHRLTGRTGARRKGSA